jgi:DNA-binding MarR family transcriptional regulator
MAGDSLHILRKVTRHFSQIQRKTWACCTPASESQCLVLTELYPDLVLSIREIAERIGSDAPWVSRVVENLRKSGWAKREQDPEDRRQVRVQLTLEGQEQAMHLQKALNDQAEEIFTRIPQDQRQMVVTALGWLAKALDQECEPVCCSKEEEFS